MGFYDRPYARGNYGQSTVGAMRMWSVTTWLIVINVAVFLLNSILRTSEFPAGILDHWWHFSAATALYHLQLWRFITFQFLHANFQHILFNMIALYFFGPMVESWLGPRRYLAFYLLSGMGGAAMYLLLWAGGVLVTDATVPLVGASAGIFGILIAGAMIAPNTTVMLLFPPIPMKLKVFALILLGLAIWAVLFQGDNAGGQAAHLGGAAVGAALTRYPRVLDVFDKWPPRRKRRRFFMDDPRR
jgi:membrane associated rhomboid family serine protease